MTLAMTMTKQLNWKKSNAICRAMKDPGVAFELEQEFGQRV